MRIESIMTRDVITVDPATPLKDVARLLVANRISGIPVCRSDGTVLGVVSEADILRKEEGVSPDMPRALAWLARKLDGELDKIAAGTAGEAMTAPALTVRPTQFVSEVARLMVDNGINRVPVVVHDKLVGIVSRADLVRAFTRSDDEIEREIRDELLLEIMVLPPGAVDVSVGHGRVVVTGRVATFEDSRILERWIRRVPGVVDVKIDLEWASDGAHPRRHARAVGS